MACTVHRVRRAISDLRGDADRGRVPSEAFPFAPQRCFVVFDVPSREVRGEHAHRVCHQFLDLRARAASASPSTTAAPRRSSRSTRPSVGLYVPPLVWASQFKYSADAVLLVLASHAYDPADYIRDYGEFLDVVGAGDRAAAQ